MYRPYFQLNTVWVTCEGENPADKENIGTIHFAPRRGFPSFYFPFMNNPGYLSPLVAVWFQEPKRKPYSSTRLYYIITFVLNFIMETLNTFYLTRMYYDNRLKIIDSYH